MSGEKPSSPMKNIYSLARALGWFSVALGLLELFGSHELDEFLGTRGRSGVVRLFGLRELGAGIGILASPQPKAGWLWARVAGDALDLGALGSAAQSSRAKHDHVAASIAAVAGVTALDIYCAWKLSGAAK